MGRRPLDITAKQLQDAINEVESANVFATRGELWSAITVKLPASNTSLMKLFNKYGLTCKTPVGHRGKEPGVGITPTVRVPRSSKYKTSEGKKHITDLKLAHPNKLKIINQVAKGSMKAAIKGMCLDCTCDQPAEIRNCNITSCFLWNLRPYKPAKEVTDEKVNA